MKYKETLNPSIISRKNPCMNRAESLLNYYEYSVEPQIQAKAIKYFEDLKKNGGVVNLATAFKEIYEDDRLGKDDPRFPGFKNYYLKLARGKECPQFTEEEMYKMIKWGGHKMPKEIAVELFPDLVQRPPDLSAYASQIKRIIEAFGIKYSGPKGEFNKDEISESDYTAPENDESVLKKINVHLPGTEWRQYSLNAEQKHCVRVLKAHLNSLRYLTAINNIQNVKHRQLFEEQFIKEVYDKPMLLPSDIDAYISLAELTVELYAATKRLHVLVKDFENTIDSDEKQAGGIGVRGKINEQIAVVSKERDATRAAIQKLSHSLNGSREKRKEEERAKNQSIAKIIMDFTDQRARDRAVMSANARNEEIRRKMEEIEGYDSITMGEINGVSQDEVFHYRYIPQ